MRHPPPVAVLAQGWGFRHAGRQQWALRDVTFGVEPGERVLLLGASGSGKSTVLAALAGLLNPDSAGDVEGTLLVDGRDPAAARDRSGLVLQDPATSLIMATVGDDVAFGLENRGHPAERIWPDVDAALALVGLPGMQRRRTEFLSGGEQQRVAVAGTVVHRPGLLLLDEPTSALDPTHAAMVRDTLAHILDETGATCIVVEHRVAEVLELVTRVVVLGGGGVVADGAPKEVLAHPAVTSSSVWLPHHPLPPRRATPTPAGDAVLTAQDVGVVGRLAPTSLTVQEGRISAVVGTSGAGKSTLAALLAGLATPDTGTVTAHPTLCAGQRTGEHAVRTPTPYRWRARELVTRIGTVFQNPEHQWVAATVLDELLIGPRRAGHDEANARRRASELLDQLRLGHLGAAPPTSLSGGEQRRLSVATALATNPALLVLDEPTFGQDHATWLALVSLLSERRDAGGSAVMVTHDAALVDVLADDVHRLEAVR